jgi:DNA-binding CsgD family transcriptional regulator
MYCEQDFHRLIAALYEASLETERWPFVLTEVARFLARTFGGGDPTCRFCGELSDPGQAGSSKEAPRCSKCSSSACGLPSATYDPDIGYRVLWRMYLDRRSALRASGDHDASGGSSGIEPEALLYWRILAGWLQNPQKAPVAEADKLRLGNLAEHLHRAARIDRERMRDRQSSRLGDCTIDAFGQAMFVVNAQLRLRSLSRRAEALLDSHAGLRLRNGVLWVGGEKEQRGLTDLLNKVLGAQIPSATMSIVLMDPSGWHRHQVFGMPLSGSSQLKSEAAEKLALILISEADQSTGEGLPESGFCFTAAERSLAEALCRGCSLKDYTNAKGVKITTVRSRLQSLFLKTGTRRQSELVALLASARARAGWVPEGAGLYPHP